MMQTICMHPKKDNRVYNDVCRASFTSELRFLYASAGANVTMRINYNRWYQ